MGVSCQLWNIKDKIKEVDDVITPERQATLGEAHPELIFRRLAGGVLRLEGKKLALGRDQRLKLLADQGFVKLSRWLTQRRCTGIGRDDLIDACACAVAARDSGSRQPGFPAPSVFRGQTSGKPRTHGAARMCGHAWLPTMLIGINERVCGWRHHHFLKDCWRRP
jgi:predicted RNase H-like nuclease